MEAVTDFILEATKSLRTVTTALVAQMVKNLSAMQETRFRFLGREDPLEKGTVNPVTKNTTVFWPGKFQDSPGGCKEPDMTE